MSETVAKIAPGKQADVMTLASKLREEGRKEGELSAKLETARKLVALGVKLPTVTEATGLTHAQLIKHGIIDK